MLNFKKNTYELAETGVYELKIESAEFGKTTTGKNIINITFVVRDDVEQPSKKTKIFEKIWENEVYRDKISGKVYLSDTYKSMTVEQKANIEVTKEYENFKITNLINAQDCDKEVKDQKTGELRDNPEFKVNFENYEEVVLFINGMNVQAKVLKTYNDRLGKEINMVDFKSLKRTSVPENSTGEIISNNISPISDDDLPF